jgi:hypothetical protein
VAIFANGCSQQPATHLSESETSFPKAISSHRRHDANAEVISADYFPLVVGSTWEYRVKYTLPAIGSGEVASTATATEKCCFGDHDWTRIRTQYFGTPIKLDSSVLFRVGEDGIYQVPEANNQKVESLCIPLRVRKGQNWTVRSGKLSGTETLVDFESVRCAEKSYEDCLHLRAVSDKGQMDRWLARGVGLVRADLSSGGISISMLLKRYEP